jgi:hypothetical protein
MTVEFPIVFHSQGVPLAARIFRNAESLSVRQPGVISMGSWLTVKEQMATLYARTTGGARIHGAGLRFHRFGESAGVALRIDRARDAPSRFLRNGDITMAPA